MVKAAMAIKARDVPTILVERIEAAHPAAALFGADEIDDWPGEVLSALLRQGIVLETDRAEVATCPGCEWQCHKRVIVRKAGDTSRAFIMCDEEPDNGRVSVSLSSLASFASDLRALGRFAASALGIGPPKVSRNLAAFALGAVRGRHGVRTVIIAIEDGRAVLSVGEQQESLARALVWGDSGLVLDAKLVHRLAARKGGTTTEQRQHAPNRSRQAARKSDTSKRDLAIFREAMKRHIRGGVTWSHVAAEIAKIELAGGLSPERVRRIISELHSSERKKRAQSTNRASS